MCHKKMKTAVPTRFGVTQGGILGGKKFIAVLTTGLDSLEGELQIGPHFGWEQWAEGLDQAELTPGIVWARATRNRRRV